MWDSPGAWADLQKDNGAFATGLNAQARLVTPAVGADQYAEITYDQDPGYRGRAGWASPHESRGPATAAAIWPSPTQAKCACTGPMIPAA